MAQPTPRFNVRKGQVLDLNLLNPEDAIRILTDLGVHDPDPAFVELIRDDVAHIDAYFRVEQRAPLRSEQAAALKRLKATLGRMKLSEKLGPVQREHIARKLLRLGPPSDLRDPLQCLTYLMQTSGAWVDYANNGTLPLPRPVAASVRKAVSLLFSIDDFSMDPLTNYLSIVLTRAAPPPTNADPIQNLEYCRDRLIEAADRALPEVSKAGPVGRPAVHIAMSYLGPRYYQLTGEWPKFNHYEATFERDPFYRFTAAILEAAGHPQSFETLRRAIRIYCQPPNKRVDSLDGES